MRKHLKKFFWFSLTALRLFSSSPLGKACKPALHSLAESVVHKENSTLKPKQYEINERLKR